MEPRSLRPYLIALLVVWLLPALLVLVLHLTLPDYNASGQCSGLGFGCTLTSADFILFFGYLAAPVFFVLGLLVCLVIAIVRARRDRRTQALVTPDRSP